MSTRTSPRGASASTGIRTAFGIGGAVALIVGLLILLWPEKTAVVFTIVLAVYALIAGLVYLGIGIFSKQLGTWSRIGHVIGGLVFLAAAIIAFTNPAMSALSFAVVVVVFIGIAWIVDGVVALTALGGSRSKGWTIFFAAVSILAGVFIMLAPLWAAAVLWLYLGIALVVLGIIQIVRAFRFGRVRA